MKRYLLFFGLLAGLIYLGSLIPPGSTHSDRSQESRVKCDAISAFVTSQEFVKRQLKAPTTAVFPWSSDDGVHVTNNGGCNFTVSAFVDAQNSFGAMLRTRFVVDLSTDDGETWSASRVEIQN